MYGRAVLAFLTVALLTGFEFAVRHSDTEGGMGTGLALPAKDVALEITQSIDSLPAKLSRLPRAEDKVKLIRQTLVSLQDLRKVSGVQSMTREMSMDFMLEPLQALVDMPAPEKKCEYLQTMINGQYEPSEGGEVSHPSLKRAQRVIASICP